MRLRLILLLPIIMISSCFAGSPKKTDIIVSIPPQAYVIEQIGNGYVDVHTLINPGQSPHTYEPTPRQMAEIAKAALYFTIGFPFEQKLVSKIKDSNSKLELVDMGQGINRRMLEGDEGHVPSHAEPDPHV